MINSNNNSSDIEESLASSANSPCLTVQCVAGCENNYARPLPVDFELGEYDVICGKGSRCFNHIGNIRFRELVQSYLHLYDDTTGNNKLNKTSIIIEIVNIVRSKSPNGGFVKLIKSTGRYIEVGDFQAREKTSQAFRDALHDKYKSSNSNKKSNRRLRKEQEKSRQLNGVNGSASVTSTSQSVVETATSSCDSSSQSTNSSYIYATTMKESSMEQKQAPDQSVSTVGYSTTIPREVYDNGHYGNELLPQGSFSSAGNDNDAFPNQTSSFLLPYYKKFDLTNLRRFSLDPWDKYAENYNTRRSSILSTYSQSSLNDPALLDIINAEYDDYNNNYNQSSNNHSFPRTSITMGSLLFDGPRNQSNNYESARHQHQQYQHQLNHRFENFFGAGYDQKV